VAATTIRDPQELPAVLTMKHVQDVLGICKPKAYELAHTVGFPVVKLGRTFRVPREAFLRWLDKQAGDERSNAYDSQK
jgi:excisionase family DNA binding protein